MSKSNKSIEDYLNATQPADDVDRLLTTIGIEKNSIGWSLVTVTTQGSRVISIERTEPDLKAITVDTFRVRAAKMFRSEE